MSASSCYGADLVSGVTLQDMVDKEGHQLRDAEAVALAADLVGLPMEEAIQRAEKRGFLVRSLAEGDVVTAEMIWNRINLTRAPDGTVLRAYRG